MWCACLDVESAPYWSWWYYSTFRAFLRVVYKYSEDGKSLEVDGTGTGGLEAFKDKFGSDEIKFAFYAVTTGDEESVRTKFVFISWVGENTKPLKRAKVSVHKGEVKRVVRDFALEIHATDDSDLDAEAIIAQVRKAGGANYGTGS
jgi:cofilin/tropomyosin-type actin-binding protein